MIREVLMIFGMSVVLVLKVVYFGRITGLVARLPLACRHLSVEVECVFVRDGLAEGRLGALVLVGCTRLVKVMRFMSRLLSTWSILLLLLCSSSAGGSSRLRMSLRVSGSMVFLRAGGTLFCGIGVRCVVKVHAGRCTPWSLGCIGSLPDLHCFFWWVFDALEVLNGSFVGTCSAGLTGCVRS